MGERQVHLRAETKSHSNVNYRVSARSRPGRSSDKTRRSESIFMANWPFVPLGPNAGVLWDSEVLR